MKTLKLRILKIGTNKLQFVKTVKDHQCKEIIK